MPTKDIQNHNMTLNLSTDDAKPRLKWTPHLHQRFIDAICQLGGAEKATPKSLMRAMGVRELTLYHLKSHLQKYRLGKQSQQSQTYNDNHLEENSENMRHHCSDETQNRLNESLALSHHTQRIQLTVQRKIQEQIKVQRHLQLRIEAQGKYLKSVLKKAQETLADYSNSSLQSEDEKVELSQLVHNGSPSTCISILTSSSEMSGNSNEDSVSRRKRSRNQNSVSESSFVEQPPSKKSIIDCRDGGFGFKESNDLNNQYVDEFDSVPKAIDLNCILNL